MFVLLVGSVADEIHALWARLRELRFDWELASVPDVPCALSMIANRRVDVVVSSSRSSAPSVALFERLRMRHPRVARLLVLESGQDPRTALAMEQAHRFLSLPLSARDLVSAVDSICELNDLLDSERLRNFVGSIGSLPPAPTMYIELRRLLASPDAGPGEIANLIGSDPASAAKVLRLCNSAYFCAGQPVGDVRSAVIRLGSETLRRVLLASELYGPASGGGLAERERDGLRDRALQASQLTLQLLEGERVDLAATASLLAEVGLLLPRMSRDNAEDPAQMGYPEAGAYLLGLWGLPMSIVEAVANHRHPSRSGAHEFGITGAVHVAHALVGGRQVDEAYLASVSMLHRLEAWRRMSDGMCAA